MEEMKIGERKDSELTNLSCSIVERKKDSDQFIMLQKAMKTGEITD